MSAAASDSYFTSTVLGSYLTDTVTQAASVTSRTDDFGCVQGLERLETKRLHASLTMCQKLVHQLANVPFDQFFKTSSVQQYTWSPTKVVLSRFSY